MKDEDIFDEIPTPSMSAHQKGSDGSPLPLSPVPQDAASPTHRPLMERQLIPHQHVLQLLVVLVVLITLAGGYGVFRALSSPTRQESSAFQQVHCPFTVSLGLIEGKDVRCGFLIVPEDRSHPQGHTIRLAVAIFKTPNPHPAPDPVLALGGGPGMPQLTAGPFINLANLSSFALDRDFILLDQRGVGYSQPSLSCQANEGWQACHDRLVKEGINLNAYTTLENAADVHDLVHALGYRQVNLEGRSYGTRLALTVMRLYPTDLRSVVLISVFPPQVNLYAYWAALYQHAFGVFFQGCMADAYCNATYPHLQTVFYRLVSDLNKKPVTFQASNPQLPVRLTGNTLVNWLFSALYDTNLIPRLPAVIFQIRDHDYTQLSFIYGSVGFSLSAGLFASIECSEDMAYTTPQHLQASVQVLAPELRPAVLTDLQNSSSMCQFWKVRPVPAIQKEPVTSGIPTLIMEGDYDPVTPSANGMLAAQTLSRSFLFLFPGVSHGVKTPNPCPHDIEYAFLDHPTEKPDASCISSMSEPDFR